MLTNAGARQSLNGVGMNEDYDRKTSKYNKSIPVRTGRKQKPSNEFSKRGLPVPFTGMKNHHLSDKNMGTLNMGTFDGRKT